MSATSQMYSDFKAVTDLFTQLNRALITAKRIVFQDSSQPDASARDSGREVLIQFLTDLKQSLTARPEDLSSPVLDIQEAVGSGRLANEEGLEQRIDRSLARLRRGLHVLRPEDLNFLDQLTAVLDQSSESLYRQMARL